MSQGARQRRAIYTVLRQWLDEEQVLGALSIFQERYRGKSSIGMHDYLSEIAPLYADKISPKSLRRLLMKLLVSNEELLAADPLPKLVARGAQPASPVIAAERVPSLGLLALHEVIARIVKWTPKADRVVLHERISLHLRQSFVNSSYDPLVEYMLSGDPRHLIDFDDSSLRSFFSLFYSVSCEVLGPAEADQLLAEAFKQVKAVDPRARGALDRFL